MLAPPLLVSYSNLDDYLDSLSPELRKQHETGIRELVERNLPPVVSSQCLAILFGYSTKFITSMANRNWKYYRLFSIQKGKKTRHIQAPKVALKVIQKWFGNHLAQSTTFQDHVYGFIPNKSAPKAAAQHANAKWVYSVDISDFFRSTPATVVKEALTNLGYSDSAAKLLSQLLCFKKNLAQGSPASPVISNIVFRDIDDQLKALADQYQLRLTRYADDIVFSGTQEFPEIIKSEVEKMINGTCWKLSAEKEYYSHLPKRLKVHGLLVHGESPRLTKGYRNKIRAYKHLMNSQKVKEKDLSRIQGHINYSNSVDKLKD